MSRSNKYKNGTLHLKPDVQEGNTKPFTRIIEVYQALGLFGHEPDNLTISISEPTGLIEELAPIPWPSEFKNGDR